MGKVLESLKRRSPAGETSLPRPLPRSDSVPATPAERASSPPRPDGHWPPLEYLPADNVPFYEVPEASGGPTANKPSLAPLPQETPSRPPLTFAAPHLATSHRRRHVHETLVVVQRPESTTAAQYRLIRDQLGPLMRERDSRSLLLLPLEHTGRVAVF